MAKIDRDKNTNLFNWGGASIRLFELFADMVLITFSFFRIGFKPFFSFKL